MSSQHDAWSAGQSYERYMGRWSRPVAARFVDWLGAPQGRDWLEVGCGSGALTTAILERSQPASILATDASQGFVDFARQHASDDRVTFEVADAAELPAEDGTYDFAVSGLVLNFLPDRRSALSEMRRIVGPSGRVAFYVWDYPGGGMEMIEAFWQVAASLDPKAADPNEARRFPFCTGDGLREICAEAGLTDIGVTSLEVTTEFADFDAFWHPFTLGTGPAPGYVASLDEAGRDRLKSSLAERLGAGAPIRLPARAWALSAR